LFQPRKRGQFFGADAILAFLLVLFALVAAGVATESLDSQISTTEITHRLTERATDSLNQLIRTPGKPADWNLLTTVDNTTIDSLGLSHEANLLDPQKVARFFNLTNSTDGFEQACVLLAIREPGYNFTLTLTYANNTVAYTTLYPAPVQSHIAASIERVAMLNHESVRARLTLWIEPIQ